MPVPTSTTALIALLVVSCGGGRPAAPMADGAAVDRGPDGPGPDVPGGWHACPNQPAACEAPGEVCGSCLDHGPMSQQTCEQCDCVRFGGRARWVCCYKGTSPIFPRSCLPREFPVDGDACAQPRDPGPCPNNPPQTRYWYNPDTRQCEPFGWTCVGNLNNFRTLEACQQACGS